MNIAKNQAFPVHDILFHGSKMPAVEVKWRDIPVTQITVRFVRQMEVYRILFLTGDRQFVFELFDL